MSSKNRYLSKSRFKLALECPTKLYYFGKDEYPSTKDDNEFLHALAEGGFQVGALAKCYHPGGQEIETLDYEESLRQTNQLLEQENVTIFEAAVRFENFFIRVDILKKTGDQIDLIEVKSKSYRPGDKVLTKHGYIVSGWLPYLQDVAFQTFVMENAFPNFIVKPYLMLADKSKKTTVEGLNQHFLLGKNPDGRKYVKFKEDITQSDLGDEILIKLPVRQYVDMIFAGTDIDPKKTDEESIKPFSERAREYAEYYQRGDRYPISISNACKSCEFNMPDAELSSGQKSGYKECWESKLGWSDEDFRKPHIFDIWELQSEKYLKQGIYLMEDLIPEEVFFKRMKRTGELRPVGKNSGRQYLQVRKACEQDDTEFIDDGLFMEMEKWNFPLHFIDFETSMVAIPFNKGRRPYEQIAFQFSCHTIYEDGTQKHDEWIERTLGKFPNFDFVAALKDLLQKDDGDIFRYSPYENTVLRQIQRQLEEALESGINISPNAEELIEWIDNMTYWDEDEITQDGKKKPIRHYGNRSMIDMKDMVVDYYYHPVMKGSNSIKAVLPAVLSASKFLKEKYSKPYRSKNHDNQIWWELNPETGQPYDPYKLLPSLFDEIDISKDELLLESSAIKEGGTAMLAYAKMQFCEMSEEERQSIISGLLKYCELDTLAMVMIYEHWKSLMSA